jgi:hypothetical protein
MSEIFLWSDYPNLEGELRYCPPAPFENPMNEARPTFLFSLILKKGDHYVTILNAVRFLTRVYEL